ncbi:MAG TPA: tetratricopeptide repeat protein [Stellaceae bacterium]
MGVGRKFEPPKRHAIKEKRACRRALVLLFVFQFIPSLTMAKQSAPITDCDRYAASDLDRVAPGVPFEKINPKIAIPACEEAVQAYPDSPRLVFELGRSYLKSTDFAAALARFRQGANLEYPPALNAIGTMYASGSGVPKDEGEAAIWYRKAAERGYVGGQLNLGMAYENGRGVPRDYTTALQWYRKAAAQGSALAQDSIGYFYGQGMGVRRDDGEAVSWFRKAAEQGMAGAQYNLGTMYEKGFGVPRDQSQVLAWYRKSADQGNENAKKKLATLTAEETANNPNSRQRQRDADANWSEKLDEAKVEMTKCLQKLPKPEDGIEQQVETVIKSDLAICGQDYMSMFRQIGSVEGVSVAAAVSEAYKTMGCRYANPTEADLETIPQGKRFVTCTTSARPPDMRPNPVNMTPLRKRAAATCRYRSGQQHEDCYIELLKGYRGHSQDLMRGDKRDSVAYCSHVAESNDGQLCAYLHDRFPALFDEEAREQIQAAAREQQHRDAEEAEKPKLIAVTARGVSVVPGAIVCPSHDTVSLIFDLYVAHWTDTQQDALTNGQSRLLRGKPAPAPDLKFYGCALLPPGTPMLLERGNIVPVVIATLLDGTTIRGVTLASMIAGQ